MLSTLNIRNFVIVEKLELDFQNGFSALTGETGAGKSILIDAIQLLFGSRSDAGLIREGADKSDLSASFTTNEKIREWLTENDFTAKRTILFFAAHLISRARAERGLMEFRLLFLSSKSSVRCLSSFTGSMRISRFCAKALSWRCSTTTPG